MEERTELEKWLKQLLKAAAQINEFFQKHLVYEDGEESLDILSDQETQTLRAIMQPGKGGRIKLVFDIPEGQVLPYIIKDPDWNAYIAFNVNEQRQVIQRVYFDDGNVSRQEMEKIIFAFEDRYRQSQRGGPRRTWAPLCQEANERRRAGELYKQVRKWLIDKLVPLILEEWKEKGKITEPISPTHKARARQAAHKRASRGFKDQEVSP